MAKTSKKTYWVADIDITRWSQEHINFVYNELKKYDGYKIRKCSNMMYDYITIRSYEEYAPSSIKWEVLKKFKKQFNYISIY